MGKVLYIINPAGHGGAGMETWAAFNEAWGEPIATGDSRVTEGPGHARALAADATGYAVIAAVGGDGTVSEVISGVLDRGGPAAHVAIVPGGTGNDIARNLGMGTTEAAVAALRSGKPRPVDVVRVECEAHGKRRQRFAFLYGSAGFSALPRVKPWMKRWFGPAIAYNLATFLEIMTFKAPQFSVRSKERGFEGSSWMVVAGNSERVSGGSVCLSPGASPEDGLLDVGIYPDRHRLLMLTQLFPKIPSGAQVQEPDVVYFRSVKIEADSKPPSLVEVDGDLFGTTPASFEVIPHAVTVMCPE
jgi:diacylglycerol kinase (ATP)